MVAATVCTWLLLLLVSQQASPFVPSRSLTLRGRRKKIRTTRRERLTARHAKGRPDSNDSSSRRSRTRASPPKTVRPGSLEAARLELNRVPYGEESRRYRRTVFSKTSDWQRHRSPDRLWGNLADIFVSGVARQIAKSIIIVVSVAILVIVWNGIFVGHVDLQGTKHLGIAPMLELALPNLPFQLCSPALGLLLVFRTNASYQRWMEARTSVARVVSQLKNVLRMATPWLPKTTEGRDSVLDLSLRCWAVMRSVQHQLRGGPDMEAAEFETDLRASGLPPRSVESLLSADDVAMRALLDLTDAITRLDIDEKKCVEIDKSAVIAGDCIESCAKIYSSPIPLVYTRHTARFLASWLLLLPLALYSQFAAIWNGILLIPATALISLFLLGIDELSVQLEEPFSILPLESSCESIMKAGEEAVKWHEEETEE